MYPADWKPDTTYRPVPKPAKEYPFTLDPFQKQAIEYIERNESVLVSAHTSAGKVCDESMDVERSFAGETLRPEKWVDMFVGAVAAILPQLLMWIGPAYTNSVVLGQ